MLFPTTLVGSYPQPEWLIDREKLAGRLPPRTRALELWRKNRSVPITALLPPDRQLSAFFFSSSCNLVSQRMALAKSSTSLSFMYTVCSGAG